MITWRPAFETGIPVVDRDHRALIDQINSLSDALHAGAAKEKLTESLVFLNHYVREHFQREERVLRYFQWVTGRSSLPAVK